MDLTPFSPQRAITLARHVGLRGAAVSPYGRAAMVAYSNRRGIAKAAKIMYASRKQFVQYARKRKASSIANKEGMGVQAGTGTLQKEMMLNGNTALFDGRTLYANELTLVAKAGATNDINTRQRQIIYVTGFSIKGFMISNFNNHNLLNIAVVSPRNNNATTLQADGFFRDYNSSRDINFSTGLSGLRMHVLPISTDKFRVLAHKRLRVGPSLDTNTGLFNDNGVSNMCEFDIWVPLKRNLQYNDDTDDNCESKVFWVMWYSSANAANGAGTEANTMEGALHAVTYYSEVAAPQRTGGRFNQNATAKIMATNF